MNGQQGSQRRSGSIGGAIFAVIAVIVVLAVIGAHMHQTATITTCTGAGTPFASCSQQVVPVTTQGP